MPSASRGETPAARAGASEHAAHSLATRPENDSALPLLDDDWDDRPIALAEGERLRAVTAAAGRFRIRAGMTVTEARARCAALEVLPWDDVLIEREVMRVTAALLVASPQVTPVAGAPGMWWIGAGGLDSLGGERALLRTLRRITRPWHPRARVAIADSCVAARAATWMHPPAQAPDPLAVIVPAGACAAYLAPAPLGLIPMDDEMRQALVALGVRTVGAFAALGSDDIERRWGSSGLASWRLAQGDDPRRPVLTRLEARRAVSVELATPATTMEPVLFLVRAALDRLVRGLVADGRAAAAVAITLTLDDGRGALPSGGRPHTITRELRPARPLARVAPLLERCRALLDRWPLSAPVSGVAVTITATAPTSAEQGDLLAPAWRDPAALDAALERLRAELGPNVVVRPIARDDHRPERAGAWVDVGPSPTAPTNGSPIDAPPAASDPSLALRLLERPEAVDVECAHAGAPTALWWRGRRLTIDRAMGPERLDGDWWADPYTRDYWRCTIDGGRGELLIYRGTAGAHGGGWFVHGWRD